MPELRSGQRRGRPKANPVAERPPASDSAGTNRRRRAAVRNNNRQPTPVEEPPVQEMRLLEGVGEVGEEDAEGVDERRRDGIDSGGADKLPGGEDDGSNGDAQGDCAQDDGLAGCPAVCYNAAVESIAAGEDCDNLVEGGCPSSSPLRTDFLNRWIGDYVIVDDMVIIKDDMPLKLYEKFSEELHAVKNCKCHKCSIWFQFRTSESLSDPVEAQESSDLTCLSNPGVASESEMKNTCMHAVCENANLSNRLSVDGESVALTKNPSEGVEIEEPLPVSSAPRPSHSTVAGQVGLVDCGAGGLFEHEVSLQPTHGGLEHCSLSPSVVSVLEPAEDASFLLSLASQSSPTFDLPDVMLLDAAMAEIWEGKNDQVKNPFTSCGAGLGAEMNGTVGQAVCKEKERVEEGDKIGAPPSSSATPWASLFHNRGKEAGMKLEKSILDDGPVELEPEELDNIETSFGFAIIGYVAGKFLGKVVMDKLCKRWGVKYKIHYHESGWMIFQLDSETDREQVLARGPYSVFGRPILLKAIPQCFTFSEEEISICPVWIKLPNLPLECWNPKALGKITSCIGNPLQTDRLTSTKERISYARVLVEIDVALERKAIIPIRLPNGALIEQRIIYEYIPYYCSLCKSLGHSPELCPKKKAPAQVWVRKTGPPPAPQLVSRNGSSVVGASRTDQAPLATPVTTRTTVVASTGAPDRTAPSQGVAPSPVTDVPDATIGRSSAGCPMGGAPRLSTPSPSPKGGGSMGMCAASGAGERLDDSDSCEDHVSATVDGFLDVGRKKKKGKRR